MVQPMPTLAARAVPVTTAMLHGGGSFGVRVPGSAACPGSGDSRASPTCRVLPAPRSRHQRQHSPRRGPAPAPPRPPAPAASQATSQRGPGTADHPRPRPRPSTRPISGTARPARPATPPPAAPQPRRNVTSPLPWAPQCHIAAPHGAAGRTTGTTRPAPPVPTPQEPHPCHIVVVADQSGAADGTRGTGTLAEVQAIGPRSKGTPSARSRSPLGRSGPASHGVDGAGTGSRARPESGCDLPPESRSH